MSELTTNVVRHTRSRTFDLLIARTPQGNLRVTVVDEGRALTTPHLRSGDVTSIGGHGLRVVDRSAACWGVTREVGGRLAVWFEIPERTFREYTRSLMDERGISLRRLAKITHYNSGYLSRVLNGHKRPSSDLIAQIDEALGANGGLIATRP